MDRVTEPDLHGVPEHPRREIEQRRGSGPPDRPIETWTHDELETLVTGFPPTPDARIHAANRLIGAADELGRIIGVALGGAAILVALALVLTPWLWIAAGAWIAWLTATIVWMIHRRRHVTRPSAPPALDPPRR